MELRSPKLREAYLTWFGFLKEEDRRELEYLEGCARLYKAFEEDTSAGHDRHWRTQRDNMLDSRVCYSVTTCQLWIVIVYLLHKKVNYRCFKLYSI